MNRILTRTLTAALALGLALPALADTYKIDPVHSETGFQIRHIVTKVRGRFAKFSGTIQLDPKDIAKSSVDVTIDASSISTENEARDKHLRSADFFEVEKYPVITFKSTAVKQVAPDQLEVTGAFTMHGVTRTLTIPVKNLGTAPGMQPGSTVAGFEAALTLNRSDYNLKTYLPVVGDDVQISLNVEAGKQ